MTYRKSRNALWSVSLISVLGCVYACGGDDDGGGGSGGTSGTAGTAGSGVAGTATTGGSSGTGGTAGKGGSSGSGGSAGKGGGAGTAGTAGGAGEAGGATDGGSGGTGGDDGVAGGDAGGAPSAGSGGEGVGGGSGGSDGDAGEAGAGGVPGAGGEPSAGGVPGAGGEPSAGGVPGAGGEPSAAGAAGATSTEPVNLIFSEYVEGSGGTDALEIYNLGAAAVDLSTCDVLVYTNGADDVSITRALTGSVAAGGVFVFCPNNDDPEPAYCDLQTEVGGGSGDFSGDDAIALVCDGVVQDVIGQIGTDPGMSWGMGQNTTADHTLRRDCAVTTGDRNGANAFTPVTEWDNFAVNTVSDLGTHACP